MRKSGILMHISSLPGKYGIGSLGKEAYEFVDHLYQSKQQLWQILPLTPTGYGDSPYQSFSTFAGNPYFIDLEELYEKGWISHTDLEASIQESIDYSALYKTRYDLLKKAYRNRDIDNSFIQYCKTEKHWLTDYALYMAIKDSYHGKPWNEWDEPLKLRDPKAINQAKIQLKESIHFYLNLRQNTPTSMADTCYRWGMNASFLI